jgi:oligosaccharyltransferase complex subunit alpha (ribophorin I)
VRLPEPLKPAGQQTLSISYSLLSSLEPLPAAIDQLQKQYLVYRFSAYAPSAYVTVKQKTKLKLPNADVPDFTRVSPPPSAAAKNNNNNGGSRGSGAEDPQRQGSLFTYGPYADVPAGAAAPVRVRYEFTRPLTHVRRLERDVELSQWGGNLATEERYWLANAGARLAAPFSRAAWAQAAYYNPPSVALRELHLPLRAGAADAYYTDDIGNVSTSRFRPSPNFNNNNNPGAGSGSSGSPLREPLPALLDVRPRYPVFGGWQYSFRVGWNADLRFYLRRLRKNHQQQQQRGAGSAGGAAAAGGGDGNAYILRVPFLEGPRQPEGIEYETVHVRVILPEGARNVRYYIPSVPGTDTYASSGTGDTAAGGSGSSSSSSNSSTGTTGTGIVPLVAVESYRHYTFMDTLGRPTLHFTAVNMVDDMRDVNIIVSFFFQPSIY